MNEAISRTADVRLSCEPSKAARERMLSRRGEPLFVAGWHRVLMIHFEVDAQALQRDVPFQLDLFEGRAFVSTVAFTMSDMRPRLGGKVAAWFFRPIATHDFLNVRTYVRHGSETGIHFLAEWLSSRLAAKLGPSTFGLPYRMAGSTIIMIRTVSSKGRWKMGIAAINLPTKPCVETLRPFSPAKRVRAPSGSWNAIPHSIRLAGENGISAFGTHLGRNVRLQ